MIYADIIVDISHEKLDKTFQYEIPEHLRELIVPGTQVIIPFGAGGRRLKGYVIELSTEPKIAPERIKPIIGVAKDSIPAESQLIALAAWIKRNYGSTMNQALKTVIPVKKKEAIKEKKTVHLRISEADAKVELQQLQARKRHSVAKERLLIALLEQHVIAWEMITGKLQIPSTAIRDLEKEGVVTISTSRDYRKPVEMDWSAPKPIVLNAMQAQAVDTFVAAQRQGIQQTYLLYGVTGSGKTQVYMEMMEEVLRQGRQVIVLIPEIALTYQTLLRFYQRFGDRVSIMNSKMSPGERFDQYEQAKAGKLSIMIGPRSALFTPFENLGLIIIDEEHEPSYKSETTPRYHARETAIARAKMAGASVVLGSATPSVESYERANAGEYVMLRLAERVEDRPLPKCEIIDLRQELKEGNRSILSRRLQELMQDRLAKKEQMMLFVNRRGLLGFVSCRACGHVIKCPHCDVSLSLHRGNVMRCHYCGYETVKPAVCPECGSKYIGGFKAGTQKFEEVVQQRFPQARILRMDMDTTRTKNGHQRILEAFANHEADILIGTQMIVKGHDFPGVTLVGILAADLSLNSSDFHSAERTFQLLTQAAGRAGRGQLPGQVIMQTYQPEHYSILAASRHDYEGFFAQEIAYRKLMHYPPAAHMLVILVASAKEEQAQAQADYIVNLVETCHHSANTGDVEQVFNHMSQEQKRRPDEVSCLGPVDATVARVNDIYRKVIYLKHADYERLVEIKDAVEVYLLEETRFRDTSVWFDFDPMSGF